MIHRKETNTMNANTDKSVSSERESNALNGWMMLMVTLVLMIGAIAWFIWLIAHSGKPNEDPGLLVFVPVLIGALAVFMNFGFFTLQPNEARVLILFGAYKGTVRQSGFWWANPLYARSRGQMRKPAAGSAESDQGKIKISLRARNFNCEKLKVNDKRGNPIEIAAVIVWRVQDTAKAAFDVDDFESYVHIQSESAVRHIASCYAYDRGEDQEPSLRESADEVAGALKKELLERLDKAGILVEEARLTHLAYAPEIAQAMLRRQQAEAVIAARQKIVHGAVSMVDMALRELADKSVVKLDDERKAAMVSNLLVVLCSETTASPVINTGTLYS
jgi:regulator of protease activity HflC (stomatin/prohibitin superfamily)